MKLKVTIEDNEKAASRRNELDFSICNECPIAVAYMRQRRWGFVSVNGVHVWNGCVNYERIYHYIPEELGKLINEWDRNSTPIIGEFELLTPKQYERSSQENC